MNSTVYFGDEIFCLNCHGSGIAHRIVYIIFTLWRGLLDLASKYTANIGYFR